MIRKFVFNDSPVFEGEWVGKQRGGEFDHFIVDKDTMIRVHEFILSDGDRHEIPTARGDGRYDLEDYCAVAVDWVPTTT